MSKQISAEVLSLWDMGHKVEAVKRLREQSGLGLKESKDLLESYAEAKAHAGSASNDPLQDPAQALQQLRDQLTQLGMKDAHRLLDSLGSTASGGLRTGTTTLKTTTTTINGQTVTSMTASGDPDTATQMLMSSTGMAREKAKAQIEEAMAHGSKLEAIKLLRENTGLGLAEAKDHIDAAMAGQALNWDSLPHAPLPVASASQHSSSSATAPGEVPRSQGWFWGVLVLLALAVAAFFYFKNP